MMSVLAHTAYFLVMELGTEDRDGGYFNKKIQLLPSVLHETPIIDFLPRAFAFPMKQPT